MTQEYIITEELLDNITDLLKRNSIFQSVIDEHLDPVYSHPHNPQAERDKVLDEVRAKYIDNNFIPCPELAEKYNHGCDAEYCGICILDFVLEGLRSKGGEQS